MKLEPIARSFRRRFYQIILVLLTLLLCKTAHFLLRESSSAAVSGALRREDILRRREYLIRETAVPERLLGKMPWFIPDQFKEEWAIGTLSMTSAALTSIAFEFPETRAQSISHIELLIRTMLSTEIRNFEKRAWGVDALDALENGAGQIGYLGHLNFMLSALRLLGGGAQYLDLYQRVSAALARRMEAGASYYVETFPGVIFTADNMVVAASLANYDREFGPVHEDLLKRWVTRTKERVCESRSGLIPFYVDAEGNGLGVPRGSGTGWNSFYLPFVNKEFAAEQYRLLVKHFVVRLPFGFAAVREYMAGDDGSADIDSGPVLFGLSTSGTGFSLAGTAWHRDEGLQTGLLQTAELVGTSMGSTGSQRYLLAPLVGDAIMLAMRTAQPWDDRYIKAG